MSKPPAFIAASVEETADLLKANNYLPDTGLATAVFLSSQLELPLFLEGEAGVGKTEVAKTLAAATGASLIRLQCYEGIDISQAVYEWDYSRQLLQIRIQEAAGQETSGAGALYSREFLVQRPLLNAISHTDSIPPVLLIDEVDRADDEFEAFLLEILSDWSVTIPELGTISAEVPPLVVLTSNRTRDVHDALKRRCIYHWVKHPDFETEVEIILMRCDESLSQNLARQVAAATEEFRKMSLYKPPGVAESIVWAQALGRLGAKSLDADLIEATLGAVLKYSEDQQKVRDSGLGELSKNVLARAKP